MCIIIHYSALEFSTTCPTHTHCFSCLSRSPKIVYLLIQFSILVTCSNSFYYLLRALRVLTNPQLLLTIKIDDMCCNFMQRFIYVFFFVKAHSSQSIIFIACFCFSRKFSYLIFCNQ